MARINPIPREDMSEEQIRVNDAIAGVRSGDQANGPFAIWLRTPELAEKIGTFGIHLRTRSSLPRRPRLGCYRSPFSALAGHIDPLANICVSGSIASSGSACQTDVPEPTD